jgi:hypothetical protein
MENLMQVSEYKVEELGSKDIIETNGGDDIIAAIVTLGIYYTIGVAVRHLWNKIFK